MGRKVLVFYAHDEFPYFTFGNNSRFHEGLPPLKRFPSALVGLQKFWAETLASCVLMTDLFHLWAYCHSKIFYLMIYQTTCL